MVYHEDAESHLLHFLSFHYSAEDEMQLTEEKLWEISQTFEEKSLRNLVLVNNIVSTMSRGDFDGAR